MEICTAEPLVPEPSPFMVKIAIAKLNRYKLLGTDDILAELIQARGKTLYSEIHKLIHSIWNKKELREQWRESIIVPIYKKGVKTEQSHYQGILLVLTSYKLLSLLPRLRPYVDEIIRHHQCGF
jgi:hypothetical protein